MATLWIAEFPGARLGRTGQPVAVLPPLKSQKITFSTTTQSAALLASTALVRVVADANCHLVVNADPTATTDSAIRLTADTAEYFEVKPGDEIAVISA